MTTGIVTIPTKPNCHMFKDKGMTEDFNAQSFVVGRFFREGGEWQFGAIGKPTRHGSVGELAESYR